jgi:hypothetical protein
LRFEIRDSQGLGAGIGFKFRMWGLIFEIYVLMVREWIQRIVIREHCRKEDLVL